MHTSLFCTALASEVTLLQESFPELADALGRAKAIITDGLLFPEDDGRTAMVRSRDGDRWYVVNGHCDCKASAYRTDPCKHRLSLRLYHKVAERLMAAEEERWTVDLAPETQPPSTIDARWLVFLHGKQFVLYAGLLAMAHARGLVSLKARFLSVTPELALAEATATFRNGSEFSEAADATPANVGAKVKAHFPRMAITRAKARALRDALNIGLCTLEELGEDGGSA